MAAAAAQAEPTQSTFNPATGRYEGYGAPAPSQGAPAPSDGKLPPMPAPNDPIMQPAGPAAQGAPPDTDEPPQSTWNPATGQYEGFPGGAPAPKKTAPLAPSAPASPPAPSFLQAAKTSIGAGIERMGAAVQEGYGSSLYSSNLKTFWQAVVLPNAVREAQKNGIALTEDPTVVDAAKLLGIRPDQFTRDWPTYVNMAPEDLQKAMDDAKAGMARGMVHAQTGAQRRQTAGQIEADVQSQFQNAPVEKFALNAASIAPEIVGGLGLSMIPGGQIPAGALLLTDFSLRGYSNGRDAGLNDQQAKLYGALSGAAAVVPEVPVLSVLAKTPAANAILESALGKVIANSVAGKVAGVAVSQGLAQTTQQALQIAIDKGVINKDTPLPDALRELGQAFLTGAVIGVPTGAAHLGINRLVHGPAPKPAAELAAPQAEAPSAPAGAPPLTPATEATRQAALSRAAQTGDVLHAAETEEDAEGALAIRQQAAQAREVAQRAAEDHFEPIAGDDLSHINQEVAPAPRAVVEAGPANIIEEDQRNAALLERARGGDDLSQVAAAVHAGAETGAHVDAATVHGAREVEAQHLSVVDQMHRQRQAEFDQQMALPLEQNAELAPLPSGPLRPEQPAVAATPSTSGAPKITMAEALPPDQLAALQGLKARRAAEAAVRAAPEGRAVPGPAEAPAPPGAALNRLATIRAAAEKRRAAEQAPAETTAAEGKESAADMELPEGNPPAPTAQTLAQRKQAALDAAMTEKVRARQEALRSQQETGNEEAMPRNVGNADISPLAAHQGGVGAGTVLAGEHTQAPTELNEVAGGVGAEFTDRAQPRTERTISPDQRETLTLRDRRARLVDEQKGRFADSDTPARAVDVAVGMHGQRPADIAKREADFKQGADYQRLMSARPGEHDALTARMTPEEAQAHLDRLNAAPGDNPAVRAALEARATAGAVGPAARFADTEKTPEQGALAAKRQAAQDSAAKEAGASAPKRSAFRDTQPGERRGPAITKEEATQRLQPLIDKVGAERLHVHDSLSDPTVPQNVRDDAAQFQHPDPRAAFDPKTGAIHVFAGAGGHPDLESLHNTAVHEMAHRGVRSFLGDDYSRTMQSVYDNIHSRAGALRSPIDGIRKASAKEWMEDYLSQHAMDPRNPEHQQTAADEYIASIAEHDVNDPRQRNPAILRRVIDAVRAGLRKLGVVHEWTDNDIRRLLRESNNNPESPHARAAREDFGTGVRFADSEDRSTERLPQDDPRAIAAKYQRVLAESANYNPGYIKSRVDALAHLKDSLPDWAEHAWDQTKEGARKLWLYSLPMDKLPDHVNPDLNPSARGYVQMVRRMNGRIGEQMAAAHEIYKPWNEYAQREPERAARLDDLMHESTLAGTDPSKPFEYRFTDEQRAKSVKKTAADAERRARYNEMRPRFEALGEEGQRIYRDVRDAYKQQRADHDAALEQRMRDLGMSDAGIKDVKALLQRDKHESGRVPEPYFPLARWGDRYAVAKHAGTDDVHSYSRFETNRQQKQWADQMRADGYDVTPGRDTGNNKAASHGVDPTFLNKVLELTKDFEPKEGSENGASIADEIYQHYLNSLPDRSYRKMFMHRTGRLGFAGNARRAFADQSIRHAKAVAAIEYGHRLDAMLDKVSAEQKNIEKLASADPNNRYLQREAEWAPDVRNELQQRHAAIRNPGSNKLVNAITGFGFHYYLGFNPATAARIHTQQYINALPWLGARHGWGPAAAELKTAMGQFAGSRGSFGDVLRGDERRAWDEMRDNGTFMNTQAQSLTSASRGDALQRSGTSKAAKLAARANYASTFMFNGIEHFNRETTAMAAYRLARSEGKGHSEALEHAMTASDTTHFDYSPANRPRILQGQAGKVGGLFAQYGVHQAYRIMRDARDGLLGNRNISPEERRARLGTLAGMLGMGTLIAGAGSIGTPVFSAINLAMNAGSDEPAFDSKAATHAYLSQHLGKFLADTIMSGPISAVTGASLGSTGLWDVFHRETSGDTAHANWYTRIAPYVPVFGSMLQGGPIGELGQDISTGVNDLRAGSTERAIEHLLPMGFRGVPKALRHVFYGEQSPSALPGVENAQTAPKSEFGVRAFLAQLANFQPQSLADRREENAAKENAVQSLYGTPAARGARTQIQHRIAVAMGDHDPQEINAAMDEARAFNKANPTVPITYDELEKSIPAQYQNARKEIHGVTIPKGMRNYLQQLYGQDLEPTNTPGATAEEEPQ